MLHSAYILLHPRDILLAAIHLLFSQFLPMAPRATPWPHAPIHQLSHHGTYLITAGTYLKEHYFRTAKRLEVLQRGLLKVAEEFGWQLEAWAIFSNHYHFIAHSPINEPTADSLPKTLGHLHAKTAAWVNRLDQTPARKVWYNFWETRLTHQTSYLARLNYVHKNAVKHGLVAVANQYPWCSANWFEQTVSPAMVESIYRFETGSVRVRDDFDPLPLPVRESELH